MRKSQTAPKPLSKSKINQIVAAVQSGKIKLSKIDDHCPTEEDVVWVWALMDSGSGVHAASATKHFPGALVQETEGQRNGHTMTAANGSKIADEGMLSVRVKTTTGHKVRIPFTNANVQMPILSIAKLAAEHDSWFGETGGELIHRKTANRIPFVKRAGVYFMRVAVKKSDLQGEDGTRSELCVRSGN